MTPSLILQAICAALDQRVEVVASKTRKREVNDVRMIIMSIMREKCMSSKNPKEPISLAEIGSYFSRDHATVLNAINRAEDIKGNKEFSKKMSIARIAMEKQSETVEYLFEHSEW